MASTPISKKYAVPIISTPTEKIDRGRQLVSACGIRPEETLMVGDTLHDAEVAQALGFRCVLYAGGHNDEARLRTAAPVIHRLKEILSFV